MTSLVAVVGIDGVSLDIWQDGTRFGMGCQESYRASLWPDSDSVDSGRDSTDMTRLNVSIGRFRSSHSQTVTTLQPAASSWCCFRASRLVALELGTPELGVRLGIWRRAVGATMPEAAVHEDGHSSPGIRDVGGAGRLLPVESVSRVAGLTEESAKPKFGLGIRANVALHRARHSVRRGGGRRTELWDLRVAHTGSLCGNRHLRQFICEYAADLLDEPDHKSVAHAERALARRHAFRPAVRELVDALQLDGREATISAAGLFSTTCLKRDGEVPPSAVSTVLAGRSSGSGKGRGPSL